MHRIIYCSARSKASSSSDLDSAVLQQMDVAAVRFSLQRLGEARQRVAIELMVTENINDRGSLHPVCSTTSSSLRHHRIMLLHLRDVSIRAESQQQLGTLPPVCNTPLLTSICKPALRQSQDAINVVTTHPTIHSLILLSGLSDLERRRRSAADQERKEHNLQNHSHSCVMWFVVERPSGLARETRGLQPGRDGRAAAQVRPPLND